MKQDKRLRARRRDEKARADRRGRMAAIIKMLGLWADFNRSLSAKLREWFLDLRAPRPVVALSGRQESNPESVRIREELEAILKRVTFPCPLLGGEFPVADYFALVRPLVACIAGAAASPQIARKLLPFFEEGRTPAGVLRSLDTGAFAVAAACRTMGFALLRHDRIDSRVHSLAIEGGRTEHGRWILRLVLDAHAPERIVAEVDGVRRPVTRVPRSGPDGLSWVEWDPVDLGLPADSGRLPVYVQGHALRAIASRLNWLDGGDWLMHRHMCHSLADPRIARRDGPNYLVEFRLQDARVGYLVCRLVRGRVVVRTFLFLTMDGTPEGDALRRRLWLARDEKHYLGLDELHAFLATDLTSDARLAELFADCGCGDLFELGREAEAVARQAGHTIARQVGHADLVSKHLGLGAALPLEARRA